MTDSGRMVGINYPRREGLMVLEPVKCPGCQGIRVVKHGKTPEGKQRYRCWNPVCPTMTFILEYSYNAHVPGVKDKIVEMALNGSGIRDTSRVLGISPTTVIETLKKKKKTSETSILPISAMPIQTS